MGQTGREQGKGEDNEPIQMEQKGVEGSKAHGKGLKERSDLEKGEWMKGKVGGRRAMGERFAK